MQTTSTLVDEHSSPVLEASFRAMGCRAHVVIHGGRPSMLAEAERRIREYEQLWSRFLDDSDVTRVNRAGGEPVEVHEDTLAIVERARLGWRQTAGRFDITVLPALLAHGYRSSVVTSAAAPPVQGTRIGRCDGIVIDLDRSTLALPATSAIDLGGIGKGFAADVVAEDLIADGATGVLVNLGGDLVVLGSPGIVDAWALGIEDPRHPPEHLTRLRLAHGGVATSGTTVRRWLVESGGTAHHLIDPATGAPARSGLSTVTVIAGDAASAEVFATAAMMLDGRAAMSLLDDNGLAGLGVTDDGEVLRSTGFAAFES